MDSSASGKGRLWTCREAVPWNDCTEPGCRGKEEHREGEWVYVRTQWQGCCGGGPETAGVHSTKQGNTEEHTALKQRHRITQDRK